MSTVPDSIGRSLRWASRLLSVGVFLYVCWVGRVPDLGLQGNTVVALWPTAFVVWCLSIGYGIVLWTARRVRRSSSAVPVQGAWKRPLFDFALTPVLAASCVFALYHQVPFRLAFAVSRPELENVVVEIRKDRRYDYPKRCGVLPTTWVTDDPDDPTRTVAFHFLVNTTWSRSTLIHIVGQTLPTHYRHEMFNVRSLGDGWYLCRYTGW